MTRNMTRNFVHAKILLWKYAQKVRLYLCNPTNNINTRIFSINRLTNAIKYRIQ